MTTTPHADLAEGSIFSQQLWKACGLQRIVLDVPRHVFFPDSEDRPSFSGRADPSNSSKARRRQLHDPPQHRILMGLPSKDAAGGTGAALDEPRHQPRARQAAMPPPADRSADAKEPPHPFTMDPTHLLRTHPRSTRTGRRLRADSAKLLAQFTRLLGDEVELPSGSSGSSFLHPPVVVSSECVSSPTDSGSDGVYPARGVLGKRSATPEAAPLGGASFNHQLKAAHQGGQPRLLPGLY